jgi:hypothetical protein
MNKSVSELAALTREDNTILVAIESLNNVLLDGHLYGKDLVTIEDSISALQAKHEVIVDRKLAIRFGD